MMDRKIKLKIINIVGARPNFIKMAALIAEMKKFQEIQPLLIHTGQHYDFAMSQVFFQELHLPSPDYYLNIGNLKPTEQIKQIIAKTKQILLKEKPDLVVVVGDVNSTLAGALAGAELNIPIAHVEAGLRSFDLSMPEEVNRILVDSLADFLFVSEPQGVKNLIKEGIDPGRIYLVGNVMIDTLIKSKIKNQKSKILKSLGLTKRRYAVLTLHRPSNVDQEPMFMNLLNTFEKIQEKIKIVWPVHPRLTKKMRKASVRQRLKQMPNLILSPPLPYKDMLCLVKESRFLLTDSGGLQEESAFLKIPCLTLRTNTERPITLTKGTNTLVGHDPRKILNNFNKILTGRYKKGKNIPLWDGRASERIIKILLGNL